MFGLSGYDRERFRTAIAELYIASSTPSVRSVRLAISPDLLFYRQFEKNEKIVGLARARPALIPDRLITLSLCF